jgi:hypothetical protein
MPVQTTGSTFSAGNAAKVFDTTYAMPRRFRSYDVSPDGERFLLIKEGPTDTNAPPPRIDVVLNWIEELKQRVPTN